MLLDQKVGALRGLAQLADNNMRDDDVYKLLKHIDSQPTVTTNLTPPRVPLFKPTHTNSTACYRAIATLAEVGMIGQADVQRMTQWLIQRLDPNRGDEDAAKASCAELSALGLPKQAHIESHAGTFSPTSTLLLTPTSTTAASTPCFTPSTTPEIAPVTFEADLSQRLERALAGLQINSTWAEAGVHTDIADALNELGKEFPWPTQKSVCLAALSHKHSVILSAPQGVGKTDALAIAAIQEALTAKYAADEVHPTLTSERDAIQPSVLVILPKRTSASEMVDNVLAIVQTAELPLEVQRCIGGQEGPRRDQRTKKYPHVDIAVGTAGRVCYMLAHHENLKLDRLKLLVMDDVHELLRQDLDEAEQEIINILQHAIIGSATSRTIVASAIGHGNLMDQFRTQFLDHQNAPITHIKCPSNTSAAVRTRTWT